MRLFQASQSFQNQTTQNPLQLKTREPVGNTPFRQTAVVMDFSQLKD